MLLLAAIAGGARHGYAIAEAIRNASEGGIELQDGTIYPALHRLSKAGLLESAWSDEGPRRRRLYSLTPRGREALEAQRDDWFRFERAIHGLFGLVRS